MTAPTMTTFNDLELWLNENRVTEVECLGSCGTAPAVQVNDDYHENLSVESFDKLLNELP